jgi:deoxyadenosine/deoxycytidine kinase
LFRNLSDEERERMRRQDEETKAQAGIWHISLGKVYPFDYGFGKMHEHEHVTREEMEWYDALWQLLPPAGKTVHDLVPELEERYDSIHEKISRCGRCTELYTVYAETSGHLHV